MMEESTETRVVRDAPAPLRMTKRRIQKEDGRYLIYYEFEEAGEAAGRRKREERA